MVLVIGYGNPLRSDDGAGPEVAGRLERLRLPGVQVEVAHQLLPEMAETLARAEAAYFVDAAARPGPDVQITPLAPSSPGAGAGHTGDPAWLLALARELYDAAPPAWLVTLPTESFAFGERLSPRAERGVDEALALLRNHIASRPWEPRDA